ncbi:MAG: hypothetical protein M3P29_08530 [Acidobacteriota bacterium]|nr:hypothetical protein [Acidobacteriota bacterium]
MIGQTKSFSNAWSLLRDPVTAEKRAILAERWATLDPKVKIAGQGLGQKATGCGATAGIQPKCDFSLHRLLPRQRSESHPAVAVERRPRATRPAAVQKRGEPAKLIQLATILTTSP